MAKYVMRAVQILAVAIILMAVITRTSSPDSYILYEAEPATERRVRELSRDGIVLIQTRHMWDGDIDYGMQTSIPWWYYYVRSEKDLRLYELGYGDEELAGVWTDNLYIVYPDLRIDKVECLSDSDGSGRNFPYYWGSGLPSFCEKLAGRIIDAERRVVYLAFGSVAVVQCVEMSLLAAAVIIVLISVLWMIMKLVHPELRTRH